MSLLCSARPAGALAGLVLVLAAAALVPVPRPTARSHGPACLLLSPNVDDHLDLAEARRRLHSPEHVRYRRLAGMILDDLGIARHHVHDALGEWRGGVENSLLVVLPGPADPPTVCAAAAYFGLAARQKAVLAFHAEVGGPDTLLTVEMPGRSLDAARRLLDRHGLCERTLLPCADGWRAVVVMPAQHSMPLGDEPGVRVSAQAGRGLFLGDPSRAAASERYRQVIRAYRATRPGRPLAQLGR
jgi:hypothetical protein